MNTSFYVNWMTSSHIIYAKLFCKLKFEIENCKFLTKFDLISSYQLLIIFLYEEVKTYFLLISRKMAAVLLKFFYEKSKMAAEMADTL